MQTQQLNRRDRAASDPDNIAVQLRTMDHAVGSEDDGDGSMDSSIPPTKKVFAPVLADGWTPYLKRSLSELAFGCKMNVLLIAVPFAFIGYYAHWPPAATFILSMVGLCPLAERISFTTEELAKHTNDTVGGLLNATLGNATELIVTVFALRAGLLRIVQVSLIGSILSNLLLVLGTAFIVGGTKKKEQTYNQVAATTNSGLLVLAVMALLIPDTLESTQTTSTQAILNLSRFVAGVMITCYGALIFYQLKTHTHLFNDEDDEEDEEAPVLGFVGALFWSTIVTILIAFLSEFAVNTIEDAATGLGISTLFISGILLPIVGNAAEHASAIIFAYRDRMELALGIAVGSAAQISLFVIPFSVLLAWAMGQPLSLDFHNFETIITLITVLFVSQAIQQGRSDWLKGLMLVGAYVIISGAFWLHVDQENPEMGTGSK
eukprot:gnl/Spiro4/12529_TR6623_c0_g1_i1.p1 gnl/Spiro4/12529_TR6623_c0_g1~~gnl/Spiro4/12529_TR6623_c0_g1_i1.p1  ORF type:complete len:434 (-),score=107.96 gnl/Spiro4/12529_TR6623_c0_g1_i1:111-1412(-)